MSEHPPMDRRRGTSIGILLVALLVLVSPLRGSWARLGAPWWTLAALWLLIILVSAWAATRRPDSA